jgi:hypothetical protein
MERLIERIAERVGEGEKRKGKGEEGTGWPEWITADGGINHW